MQEGIINSLTLGQSIKIRFHLLDKKNQIHLSNPQSHLIILYLPEIQQLVDHTFQAFRILLNDADIICESACRSILRHLAQRP